MIFIFLGLVLRLSSSHYFGDITIPKYFCCPEARSWQPHEWPT